MCGIAGILTNNALDYENNLKKMTNAIAHRGPDAEGHFYNNNIALGHRRLSIVDLSETGVQPMHSHTKNETIVFNGEIYGYLDLKKQIINYPFKGHSDTEIILALYQTDKENLLQKLNGMFAFALWNEEKQELFCARDRFGEKPFYYAYGKNGEFIFASEIKAIIASQLIEPILNKAAITHYLQHLYINPQETIYENIFTLPAAHYLTIQKNSTATIQRYWQMPITDNTFTLKNTLEIFKEKFDIAVKNQLVADVPVGAFLSGGLDSSTVVAVASKYKEKLTTLSFGFGNDINELPFAKEIAQKYNTNHIEINAPLDNIDTLLLEMATIYDEPFADSSNIPTYLISKLAKEHLTVVLTGDGGDEFLGGYGSYKKELQFQESQINNPNYLSTIFSFTEKIARKLHLKNLEEKMHLNFATAKFSNIIDYHKNHFNNYFTNNELQLLGVIPKNKFNYSFLLENNLNTPMKMDVENYMCGDILVKTDRAAMANSLELRAPFLDVDFATFCLQIPYQLKLNTNSEKNILREAYSNYWTESINKRSKQGFGSPVDKWLKLPKVTALKNEILLNKNNKMYNYLDFDAVQTIAKNNNYKTWILLTLGLFFNKNS